MVATALLVAGFGAPGEGREDPAPHPGPDRVARGAGGAVTIAAAGDIAEDGAPSDANIQTAALIEDLAPDAVLTLGDNQYQDGELAEYLDSYDLTWGRFKDITYPTPGNHDYHTEGARGYFDYFGERANPPDGYYSFDLGNWHLVAVNTDDGVVLDEQLDWIRRDLRSDPHRCELAYWHHPRWSSGSNHGSDPEMQPLWRLMVRQGVDVVLNGHDHLYERFARLNASGRRDRDGVREIIAGTGGYSLYGFGDAIAGSQKRIVEYGVLTMTLKDRGYAWAFLRAEDGNVLDDGKTACHA
jgi:3',5'-cyclic AMP phosphodiesterase CpdA